MYLLVLLLLASGPQPDLLTRVGVTLDGPMTQGGVIFGKAQPGSQILLNGNPVRVDSKGNFILGFDRDATDTAELEVIGPDGSSHRSTMNVEERTYRIERVDGLPPAQVSPPPEVLARIRNDTAQIRAARARDDNRSDFLGGFHWPATGRISGVYGSQRILNGQPRRPHYGVDVAGPVGTPVYAPAAGMITLAHEDMYYSGGTLIIDHGHQLSSTFLHLSEILVTPGERVEPGQLVARMGATGRATGSHLDWRMNWKGARVDPELLVGPMPAQ